MSVPTLDGLADAYALGVEEVARRLATDPKEGLGEREANSRLELAGLNVVESAKRPPYLAIAARQVADPLVALLIVAAVVSALIGERIEACAIGAIVMLDGLLGFFQEVSAERAILALQSALRPQAGVVREGHELQLATERIVPGDVIVVREGERVAADARLVEAGGLSVDESALTGESIPDDKAVVPLQLGTPLAERTCQLYAGTSVVRGQGRALVTATGTNAEIGKLARLAQAARPPRTPLQQRLEGLTRIMVVFGLLITVLLAAVQWLHGSSVDDAFLLGVSVAVAAVPEGLAATVTIALALGASRMADRGALVRRLPAVETLGSATLIASDKTGTLTENRLRVARCESIGGYDEDQLLRAAALCSTAGLLDDGQVVGDPVDGALLRAARERGALAEREQGGRTVMAQFPFDAERKRMTIVYRDNGRAHAFVKGAPEILFERSTLDESERVRIEQLTHRWAAEGLRVLAVAEREIHDLSEPLQPSAVEAELSLVGVVGLQDPLRPGARSAVAKAREAGIAVEVLTGDHPATAQSIAAELGLDDASVAARITPAGKLDIVERCQSRGEVVAVTGDGVNDAPALRKADVGVAMGRSGTEAAREASDVVLTDDNFSTIVAAIREGRAITDNIRRFVAFLLSANFGEVLLFAIAVSVGLGAPMTVVQILLVNVLTDGLPAVALARDPAAPNVMRRPPERERKLFERAGWLALAGVGAIVGAAAMAAFLVGRSQAPDAATTMAFATVALSELLVVFAVRSPVQAAWRAGFNPLLIAGVALSLLVVVAAMYVPALQDLLDTRALDGPQLSIVAGLSLAPALAIEAAKPLVRRYAPALSQRLESPAARTE